MGAVAAVDTYIFAPPRPSSYDVDHRHFVRTGPHHGAFLVSPPEASERCRGAIIYLHANACDCNTCYYEISRLTRKTKMPVLAPEYPGYGPLEGPPSIEGVNEAVYCGYQYARDILGVQPAHVVLYGRSLGTGAAMHLAKELALRKDHIGAVVLLSPFDSLDRLVGEKFVLWRVVASPLASLLARNMWDNGDALSKVQCPTLILHGQEDTIIPIEHAIDLVKRNPLAEAQFVAQWKHNMNFEELRTAVGFTAEFLRNRTRVPMPTNETIREAVLHYDGDIPTSARGKHAPISSWTSYSDDESGVPAKDCCAPLPISRDITPRLLHSPRDLVSHAFAHVVQEEKQEQCNVAAAVQLKHGWAAAQNTVGFTHQFNGRNGAPPRSPIRGYPSHRPALHASLAYSAPSAHTSRLTASPLAASRFLPNNTHLPAQPITHIPRHIQHLNNALEQHQQQQQQQQHEPEPECDETQKDTNFVPRKQPATATNCEAEPAQAQSQNDPTPGTPRCQDHVPEPADSKEKEPTPSHTSPSAPMDEDKSPEHKDEDCRSTESDDANAPDSSDDDTDATGRMYASDLQINKERAVAYKNRAVHSFERAIHVAGTKGWKTPSLYTEHIPSLCRNICNAIDHNERVLAMVLGAAAKNNDDATIVRAHAREWNESLIQHLCRLLWLWRSAMSVEECPLVRYQYGRFCLTALRPLRTQASHLLHQYPPLTIVWCTLQVEMLTCSLARSQALHRTHPVAEAIRAHNDAWEDEVHQVDNALSCHAPLIATVRQHYENNTDVTPHKAILGMILCRAEAAEARLAFMRRRAVIVRIVRHAVRRAQKLWTGLLATQVDQDSVLDDLWYAYTIADNCTGSTGGDKGRTNDDPGWPDVEMGCICVHELARVHHVLGTKNPREGDIGHVEKAYELHLETLRRACAMSAEHVQGDPEGGLLSTRSWYIASHAYIKKARAERERRLAQSHAQDLVHIRPELTHVQNTFAAVSMLDFLHFLYTTYPPYSHVRNNVNVVLPDRVTETSVLQAIQQYAPTLDDEPRTSSLLCAEILKFLNTWYIDRYKSATTNGREAERGTKPSPPLHERYERSTSCHDAERSPRASRRDEAPSARASSTIHGDARGRRQRGWCARRAASVGTMLSGCTDEREFCPLL
eukprot:GEMP01003368.1.p1 GENE.GEMP01003368.1~~GEMP01003368.1.p1  ORF type:complete len:1147 (+),score=279.90 GEMP01003368.1:225-3665(+)